MGFLSRFSKPAPTVLRLPSGSFTVDREGSIVSSTLRSSYPATLMSEIARQVLAVFEDGVAAQLPLHKIIIKYPSLKITASELHGGAIIYLSPQALSAPANAT